MTSQGQLGELLRHLQRVEESIVALRQEIAKIRHGLSDDREDPNSYVWLQPDPARQSISAHAVNWAHDGAAENKARCGYTTDWFQQWVEADPLTRRCQRCVGYTQE